MAFAGPARSVRSSCDGGLTGVPKPSPTHLQAKGHVEDEIHITVPPVNHTFKVPVFVNPAAVLQLGIGNEVLAAEGAAAAQGQGQVPEEGGAAGIGGHPEEQVRLEDTVKASLPVEACLSPKHFAAQCVLAASPCSASVNYLTCRYTDAQYWWLLQGPGRGSSSSITAADGSPSAGSGGSRSSGPDFLELASRYLHPFNLDLSLAKKNVAALYAAARHRKSDSSDDEGQGRQGGREGRAGGRGADGPASTSGRGGQGQGREERSVSSGRLGLRGSIGGPERGHGCSSTGSTRTCTPQMGRGGAPSVSAYQWGPFGPGSGEQGGGLDRQWEVLEELAQPLIVTPEVVLTLQVGHWRGVGWNACGVTGNRWKLGAVPRVGDSHGLGTGVAEDTIGCLSSPHPYTRPFHGESTVLFALAAVRRASWRRP